MLNYIKHYILVILTLTTFLQSEEPLSIGFWNAENLFDLENDPNKNDDEFSIGGRKNVTQEIYYIKKTGEQVNCSPVSTRGII